MKKNIFFFSLPVMLLAGFMLASCSGGSKKNDSSTDTLDSAKVLADSLKKIADAKPKFLVIKGTNVNLRVDPGVKAKKIKQLKTNDTCEILEKSKLDTVGETVDYWYKIKFKTKEGWVYGEFTSLKMPKEAPKKSNIFFKEK
jgi:hypothetical protein